MKKVYIKPEAEIIEFENEVYMLTGSPEIGAGGDANDDEEANSNRHRGEWGNLWAED